MNKLLNLIVILSAFFNYANAECANACNGHGKCTSYDMCICNRNWQAADCSERVCQFGLAHVDSPKGDLDGSGTVTGPNLVVVENNDIYPYGTTEQFPEMRDTDLNLLTNSAHYYMECSNKGKCDRSTGECQCYDGYDGVACQRASCPGYPNSCSGHGVCKYISQLADSEYGNVYKLWDKKATMGCECDKGYTGPDCSIRECKYGVDPLYLDDASSVKYSVFNFATISTANASSISSIFTDGQNQYKQGHWAIRFYDIHGEDWLTEPIVAGASCADITTALYNIPNDVVPMDSIYCTKFSVAGQPENIFTDNNQYVDYTNPHSSLHPYYVSYKLAFWDAQTPLNQGPISQYNSIQNFNSSNGTGAGPDIWGYIYMLKFYGNPGKIRQPEIEVYLDGNRPSIVSPGGKVITAVWTDGDQGENDDYFADHCDGVTVTIAKNSPNPPLYTSYLTGYTTQELDLLKACLGGSDFSTNNNIEVYNWDRGDENYPHIVKLVRTVTSYTNGGYYAVLWYDVSEQLYSGDSVGTFKLLNPFFPPDHLATDDYDVFTTKGVLALTSNHSQAAFSFGSRYVYTTNVTYDILSDASYSVSYDGDISCEVNNNNGGKFQYIMHCLNRSDIFTLINWDMPEYNPEHLNLYTAERLYTGSFEHSVGDKFTYSYSNATSEMHYLTHMITTDLSTNWGNGILFDAINGQDQTTPRFRVYKFFPDKTSTYNYVAQCSNRGICQTDSGLCQCFPGYTSDACQEQSSLSV